jgi:hypothetical protein
MMLILADSRANGSLLRLANIASRPTFTDSIGSPTIEPDVSINKYTGSLLIIIIIENAHPSTMSHH